MKKTKKEKVEKKSGKIEFHEGRILGVYRPTGAKGQIVAKAMAAGKITEEAAKKIAKGKSLDAIFFRIRKFGKRSKLFQFFRSKKTEGLWIFKMTGKVPKLAKKAA